MARPTKHEPDASLRDGVWAAQQAADRGEVDQAIALLRALVKSCANAARIAPSEWHEIQARWSLGSIFEGCGRSGEAARQYTAIADLRRAVFQEAIRGYADAVVAAAACEARAGRPSAARRLARQALRSLQAILVPHETVEALQAAAAAPARRNPSAKRRRRE